MCQCGCQHENFNGDCTARCLDGLLPCDDGYPAAKEADDHEKDRAAEARAEMRREE